MFVDSPYKIIRSSRKTAAIEIRAGVVIIRVPKELTEARVAMLVSDKKPWIERQLQRSKLPEKKQFLEGEQFRLLGNNYSLHLVGNIPINNNGVSIKVSTKYPIHFLNDFYLFQDRSTEAHKIFTNWYKKKAKELFSVKLDLQANIMQVTYTTLKITSPASRWGSCSTKGSVNLNWRLIMAPEEIIDYVILHELSHLFEPNHSKRFWAKVEEFDRDYRRKREWLKKNGSDLTLG